MRKIGVITYVKTATCNYGAELQAFALQYKLNKDGFDTEVVNLKRRLPSNDRFKETVKKSVRTRFERMNPLSATLSVMDLFLSVVKDKYYAKKYASEFQEKKALYERFFEENIRHSSVEYNPDDMDTADLPYNTYIAGSDQIWNYKNSDRVDVFFLMFANRFKAKKISYAASFSISEIPENYKERYTEWINNIDEISVRETDGVRIVKDLTGRDAVHVCDPTLLLDKNEWRGAFGDNPVEEIGKKKYVFVYTMSRSRNVYRIAKTIARQLGNIEVVHVRLGIKPEANDGVIHLNFASPQQWVHLLMNAEYVVTDSFHGTVFSINFNIPFTVVQNPMSDLNSRVNTILTKVGLLDRIYVDDKMGRLPECLNVDYNSVNCKIDEWRKQSWQFLLDSLKTD